MSRLAALLLLIAPACWAAEPPARGAAEASFARPVRAGDLIGRKLIGPSESQPLLGRVEGVDRGPAGTALRVRTGGLLPIGGHIVDVPIAGVALLGEHVALLGLSAAQLEALPSAGPAAPVPADESLRVGLVRPFH